MNRAKLRVCGSCEWIYLGAKPCPMCGFGSFSARYVYGKACYRLKLTQKPWMDRKMHAYGAGLLETVCLKNEFQLPRLTPLATP